MSPSSPGHQAAETWASGARHLADASPDELLGYLQSLSWPADRTFDEALMDFERQWQQLLYERRLGDLYRSHKSTPWPASCAQLRGGSLCLTTWSEWTSTPSTTSGLTWETSGQRTTPSVARRVRTPAATVTARVQPREAAHSVAPADTVDRCTSTGSVIVAQLAPVQGPARVQHQPRHLSQWHHPEAPLARPSPLP